MVHLSKMYQIEWIWWHRWSALQCHALQCVAMHLYQCARCKTIIFANYSRHETIGCCTQNKCKPGKIGIGICVCECVCVCVTHMNGNRYIRFWESSKNQCHFRFDIVKEILFSWNKLYCASGALLFLLQFFSSSLFYFIIALVIVAV